MAATVHSVLVFDHKGYGESRAQKGAAPWKRHMRLVVRFPPRQWVGLRTVYPMVDIPLYSSADAFGESTSWLHLSDPSHALEADQSGSRTSKTSASASAGNKTCHSWMIW